VWPVRRVEERWQEGERAEARSSHRIIARKEYAINTYFYRKNRSPRHARVSERGWLKRKELRERRSN